MTGKSENDELHVVFSASCGAGGAIVRELAAGELSSELRPRQADGAASTTYLSYDPPLSLLSEGNFSALRFEINDGQSRMLLNNPANPTGPERVFVFESLAANGPPTS